MARLAIEAIETVAPLRRCSTRLRPAGAPPRDGHCSPAQLGVALCPCSGDVSPERYGVVVDRVLRGLTVDPGALLEPLGERVVALAAAERYEEAADARDRAAALALALRRGRRFDALRAAGRVELALPGGVGVVLDGGLLRAAWGDGELPGATGPVGRGWVDEPPALPPVGSALPAEAADELTAVASYLDRYAARVRVLAVEGEWSTALPALPTFRPRRGAPLGSQ